jgi:hypothetical protein
LRYRVRHVVAHRRGEFAPLKRSYLAFLCERRQRFQA